MCRVLLATWWWLCGHATCDAGRVQRCSHRAIVLSSPAVADVCSSLFHSSLVHSRTISRLSEAGSSVIVPLVVVLPCSPCSSPSRPSSSHTSLQQTGGPIPSGACRPRPQPLLGVATITSIVSLALRVPLDRVRTCRAVGGWRRGGFISWGAVCRWGYAASKLALFGLSPFVFSVRPSVDTLVRVSTLLFPLCSLHVIVSVCVSVCSCVCGASFISNVRPAGGNAVPGLSSRVRSAVIRSSGPLSRVCCVFVPIRSCPWLLNALPSLN